MSDMHDDTASHEYAHVVQGVMKRQAALGLRVASVFVVLIVGLPLFNLYWPKLAAASVAGFTLTWLVLGVAFFPVTWLLSAYFVRESDRIESDAARSVIVQAPLRVDEPAAKSSSPDSPDSPDKDAK